MTPQEKLNRVLELAKQRDIIDQELIRLFTEPQPITEPKKSTNSFIITVDYSLLIEEMIEAGKYDWKNDNITAENFPHDSTLGEVEIEAEYVHYNRNMGYDAVIDDLNARGMRPATMVELLVFGAAFPDEQRKFPIVALGSVCEDRGGGRYVGCLYRSGSERDLNFHYVASDWGAYYRFLAVRK